MSDASLFRGSTTELCRISSSGTGSESEASRASSADRAQCEEREASVVSQVSRFETLRAQRREASAYALVKMILDLSIGLRIVTIACEVALPSSVQDSQLIPCTLGKRFVFHMNYISIAVSKYMLADEIDWGSLGDRFPRRISLCLFYAIRISVLQVQSLWHSVYVLAPIVAAFFSAFNFCWFAYTRRLAMPIQAYVVCSYTSFVVNVGIIRSNLAVVVCPAILFAGWRWQRFEYDGTGGISGMSRSHAFAVWWYAMNLLVCCMYIMHLSSILISGPTEFFWRTFLLIVESLMWLLFALLVFAIGRDNSFTFLERILDRADAGKDGAFMAELLMVRRIVPGMTWWVHHGENKGTKNPFDPHRNWTRCQVVEGSDDGFFVEPMVSSSRMHHTGKIYVKMMGRSMPAQELLAIARRTLRCIDWETMTFELMSGAISGNTPISNMYYLSRPVQSGETIDYFMSHSWHDDAKLKWHKLTELANRFQKDHGRFPTFWLDKVCIDQDNIGDGLRVLPVNVMDCSQMLVLCGSTYPRRLWCAWELCTLVSFTSEASIRERVELLPICESSACDVLTALQKFDVKDAHCYDPNEEATLVAVISAVGKRGFNDKIRRLVSVCERKPTAPRTFAFALNQALAGAV